MKQMKFFMIALTMLMGVTFTSCLDSSDSGSTYDSAHLALIESGGLSNVVFKDALGTVFYPTFQSVAALEANSSVKISQYGFGMVYYKWIEGKKPTADKLEKSYEVELVGFEGYYRDDALEATTKDELGDYAKETAPVSTLDFGNNLKPFQFNEEVIVLPIAYFMGGTSDALKQHKLVLACPVDDIQATDRNLTFYLHHDKGTDDKVTTQYASYFAYDIADVLYAFENKTGQAPQQIIIMAHATGEYGSATELPKDYTPYPINYEKAGK